MTTANLVFIVMLIALASYWLGIQRSIKVAGGKQHIKHLTSLPSQYGLLTAFWCGIPAILFFLQAT